MIITITEEDLNLYQSLFRGRTDIFAKHWEKNGQSGYSPAYDVDWTEFNKFKLGGGSFRDFQNKKPIPLTPEVLRKHLLGQYAIGIYPILSDNTSYFIAADFDGENWQRDARIYIDACQKFDLQVYLERSKSGNGCHAWIFFENSYPCYKSRQMILEIIRQAFKLSEFDKEVSFDRLFPNQDTLIKNGFGNLIALPLQGRAIDQANTIFLNPESFQPYPNQWELFKTIHKHTPIELDNIFAAIFNKPIETSSGSTATINLVLNNKIVLNRSELSSQIIHFLKEKLNFMNTEYLTKRRLGKSVYKVQKFFKLIEEDESDIFLPRGFLNQLISFLNEKQISFHLSDQRPSFKEEKFTSNIKLLPEQVPVVKKAIASENGVIVAPSGSGKTIIGLEIIAQRKLPALILVNRKQLLEQWVERIQTFLEIPKKDIGQYHGVKKKEGKQITVAMIQTLVRIPNFTELQNKFGTIIVDECHHVPAKSYREVVSQFNPQHLYGLTATPRRKHNDESLIYAFIGDIIAEMEGSSEMAKDSTISPKAIKSEVIIRETNLNIPFKFSTDNFQLLAKLICFDTNRNQLIVKDILEQTSLGKKVLLLSERRDHLEILNLYLKGQCETITISGEDSNAKRNVKLKQIENGHYQAILSTGQFFGEGLDIPNIDCLIIAFPFSFEGKLIQYIGRLRGKKNKKTIIDYADRKIAFLDRQFKQRKRYYNKLGKPGSELLTFLSR